MKWENTLMAYEEDIKSRGFWDWVKAHTSFMKPLHRHEGFLELNEGKITFTGKDVKEDKDFNLEIVTGDITQSDLPKRMVSGLVKASKILKGIDSVKILYFDEKDVVRHPLVQTIIKRFENDKN